MCSVNSCNLSGTDYDLRSALRRFPAFSCSDVPLACPRARSLQECNFLRHSRAFGVLKVERKAKIYFCPVFVPHRSTIMSYCNVLRPCLAWLSRARLDQCQMQNRSTTMAYTPARGTILGRFWNDRGTTVERFPACQVHDLMSETDCCVMAQTHIAYCQQQCDKDIFVK